MNAPQEPIVSVAEVEEFDVNRVLLQLMMQLDMLNLYTTTRKNLVAFLVVIFIIGLA